MDNLQIRGLVVKGVRMQAKFMVWFFVAGLLIGVIAFAVTGSEKAVMKAATANLKTGNYEKYIVEPLKLPEGMRFFLHNLMPTVLLLLPVYLLAWRKGLHEKVKTTRWFDSCLERFFCRALFFVIIINRNYSMMVTRFSSLVLF